jgi:hypothetical protein
MTVDYGVIRCRLSLVDDHSGVNLGSSEHSSISSSKRKRVKIDLRHFLHWPLQLTTIAGVAILGVGLFLVPGDRLAGISYRTHSPIRVIGGRL